ncbi:SWIM zinc finger family protein [Caldinitratiruptor microaerophilus]|uniref:SWIM-type domain-containing protein n=1 Tax=Caldinitratiruptor microaerophilus TaxID=671077 RepID=A0AA35G766_9FIRM|nr:SWIM zinc finger family protein [Caldinitratiruptor microaerophilus]BDG59495.1 hypothetical protein caldi_05850 [Caldinitratiruptor microaerophilus]
MGRKPEFGSNWWAQRWTGVLESFGWASRLRRGRAYARAGNVLAIVITPGTVEARVQGSRPQPYRVTIALNPLSDREWEQVTRAMAGRAVFAARLLAGEMPENIEEAFAAAGVTLFPRSARDLRTACSCPDWANPCKHIAAVFYRLGQEFDADPFVLFRLRGRDRDQVLDALRAHRAAAAGGPGVPAARGDASGDPDEGSPDLAGTLDRFWTLGPEIERIAIRLDPPDVVGAVLRRLGPPAGLPDAGAVLAHLSGYYEVVTRRAREQRLGGDPAEES